MVGARKMASRYLTEDEIRDILCEDSGSEGFVSDSFDTDEEVEDCIGKFVSEFLFVSYKLTHFIVSYMTAPCSLHLSLLELFSL